MFTDTFSAVPVSDSGRNAALNAAVTVAADFAEIGLTQEAGFFPTGYQVSGDFGFVYPRTNQSGPLINHDLFLSDSRYVGVDGTGFAAVILDTGIDLNHPFFGPSTGGVADRIVFSFDFADNDADASDFDSHGSNVFSIIASEDPIHLGMPPGADIIHLKVFPDSGALHLSMISNSRCNGW